MVLLKNITRPEKQALTAVSMMKSEKENEKKTKKLKLVASPRG